MISRVLHGDVTEAADGTARLATMERQQDYVLRSVEERGVRLVRLWFTDVLGQLKSFAISPAELENALEEGMTFDGSSIDGFSRVQESDVLARPDANSFELLPWADPHAPEARIFCDICNLDGTPFEGDPRQVLRRNLDRARARGFTFYVAPEMEFFYFAPATTAAPCRSTPARTSTSPPPTSPGRCASARSRRSRRWASRSSTRSTRTRRASTRSTSATPTPSRWPTA